MVLYFYSVLSYGSPLSTVYIGRLDLQTMSGCISYGGRETRERLYQVHIRARSYTATSLRSSIHPDEAKNIKITIARPGCQWLHLRRGMRSLPSSLSAPAYRPQLETHGTRH